MVAIALPLGNGASNNLASSPVRGAEQSDHDNADGDGDGVEADFMAQLLGGLDEDAFDEPWSSQSHPSPLRVTPAKNLPRAAPRSANLTFSGSPTRPRASRAPASGPARIVEAAPAVATLRRPLVPVDARGHPPALASYLSSSPPKHPRSTPKEPTAPSASRPLRSTTPAPPWPSPSSVSETGRPSCVRCRVTSVTHGVYQPRARDELDFGALRMGVRVQTILGAASRREVVLGLEELHRVGEEEGTREGDETKKERVRSLSAGHTTSSSVGGVDATNTTTTTTTTTTTRAKTTRQAVLRDEWLDTPVQVGDIVHLVGAWTEEPSRLTEDDDAEAGAAESDKENAYPHDQAQPIVIDDDGDDDDDDVDRLFASIDEASPMVGDEDLACVSSSSRHAEARPTRPLIATFYVCSHLAGATSAAAGVPRLPSGEDENGHDRAARDRAQSAASAAAAASTNLLILHPDVLLTATAVSSISTCLRKPVVQSRLRPGASERGATGESVVLGSLLHEVFQDCLLGGGGTTTTTTTTTVGSVAPTRMDGGRLGEISESGAAAVDGQIARPSKPTSAGAPPAVNVSRVRPQREDALAARDALDDPSTRLAPRCDFTARHIRRRIEARVRGSLESLLGAGMDTSTASEKLWEGMQPFRRFARVYLADQARWDDEEEQTEEEERGAEHVGSRDGGAAGSTSKSSDGGSRQSGAEIRPDAVAIDSRSRVPPLLRIVRVLDVEEDIWSPTYGLKGKVDVSVEVDLVERDQDDHGRAGGGSATTNTRTWAGAMARSKSEYGKLTRGQGALQSTATALASVTKRSQSGPQAMPSGGSTEPGRARRLILPLELKTGRAQAMLEHRAQTMLYTLMMSDRYGCDVDAGLLFYSKTGELHRVRRVRNELRALVLGRNELAAYLTSPPARVKVPSQRAHLAIALDGEESEASEVLQKREVNSSADVVPTPPPRLPAPIDAEHTCKRCYVQDGCFLYRRATIACQNDSPPTSEAHTEVGAALVQPPSSEALAEAYAAKTAHLTHRHAAFFAHWDRLLSLEERDGAHGKRELWTMTSSARERLGRCFSRMVLDASPIRAALAATDGEIAGEATALARFVYRFVRAVAQKDDGPSLLGGQMGVGDPITISYERGPLAINQGFILELAPTHVVISLERPLAARLAPRTLATDTIFPGTSRPTVDIEDLASGGSATIVGDEVAPHPLYRIDKDEMASGMSKIRHNLARLFYAPAKGDVEPAREERLRRLIVDLEPPRFVELGGVGATTGGLGEMHLESDADDGAGAMPSSLNADQAEAVRKVLRAEDYALVVGMPGTGKTTTISELIRMLARRGKSVLLVSYTHSAVDTICRKLLSGTEATAAAAVTTSDLTKAGAAPSLPRAETMDLLRLGRCERVHPDVRGVCLDAPHQRQRIDTVERLEARLLSANVVATTCLSVDHVLFARRRRPFDVCVVDEASQVTLPTCLGALRFAQRFVLVGDPQQLPPLVRNAEARRGGLEVSLFARLAEAHPQSLAYLTSQYRMNADIMSLSNALIYGGRLRCGSEAVARATLEVAHLEKALALLHGGGQEESQRPTYPAACLHSDGDSGPQDCWLRDVASAGRSVVFLDTDNVVGAEESVEGTLTQNVGEAELVRQVCAALVLGGVGAEDIAVITPLRQQIKLITHVLRPNAAVATTGGQADAEGDAADRAAPAGGAAERVAGRGIEVLTADRSQGRDKRVVIVSFVRSQRHAQHNLDGETRADDAGGGVGRFGAGVGELLGDVRRINVALTRAQHKLVLVGSRNTLSASPLLRDMLRLLEEKRWIRTLPSDALASATEGSDAHHVPAGVWRCVGAADPNASLSESRGDDEADGRDGNTVGGVSGPPSRTSRPDAKEMEAAAQGMSRSGFGRVTSFEPPAPASKKKKADSGQAQEEELEGWLAAMRGKEEERSAPPRSVMSQARKPESSSQPQQRVPAQLGGRLDDAGKGGVPIGSPGGLACDDESRRGAGDVASHDVVSSRALRIARRRLVLGKADRVGGAM